MDNKWIQITFNDAILYCERAGFKCKEVDLFESEIKEFYLPNTKIQFKYRIYNGDPVKFYICPMVDGKIVDYETFKQEVETAKKKA
ncbi:MAG: hypothetical protein J6L84_01560 [Clostridiales bacterium]|nr:hypothetical protein [Clostridiales bacterium]